MPKVGGRRKKNRSHKEPDPQQQRLTPKTFVFKKGKCPEQMKQLTQDLRKCFYPNTAMKLEDTNKMSVKSYLKAAKYYNVNHMVILQHMNGREYIRFIKVGGGEMTFRIMNFCRMKDVLKNGGQPFSYSFKQCLLVLNGFGQSQQVKMIGKGLQELFPSLNLEKAKTQNLKRVISFTYRPKKKFIFMRQYKIVQHQGGVSNSFQKLMDKPKDLSNFRSLKEYLESQTSAIQGSQNQQKLNLKEIGPRLKLKFVSYKQTSGVLSQKDLQDAQNEYVQRQTKKANKKSQKNDKSIKKLEQDQGQNEQENQYQENQEVDMLDQNGMNQEENQQDGQGLDQDQQADQIDLQSGEQDQQ